MVRAYQLVITGRVQGVGFRPHAYRLANQLGLCGWVRNCIGNVEIHIQGNTTALDAFMESVVHAAPPFAVPKLSSCKVVPVAVVTGFSILNSVIAGQTAIYLPPDIGLCQECLTELYAPNNRRYRYPFLNCTQCGPRYTIVTALPYDRSATSMAGFTLCADCHREYLMPDNRRFHAEPLACTACGPTLTFHTPTSELQQGTAALAACVAALQTGQIIAVRGIGGYHLCCRAEQESSIARLRQRKVRPHKPLAVMFPAPLKQPLREVAKQVLLSPSITKLLLAPQHPIILAKRRRDCTLPALLAPGLDELGVFLPYSPLHHLLLNDCGVPLVATSANLSGEPVLTEPAEVVSRLHQVADGFLHHNRPIVRPADDPVYRVINGRPRPLRLGRGNAPLELSLPFRLQQPLLATGGHLKNTIALAWEQRIVISPHIGDLSMARSFARFTQTIDDLQRLYAVTASAVVCDAHPGYASTRWAQQCGLPWHSILHHHAHASATYGNAGGKGDWLVFTWDGVGYGADGTIQGGEALLGRPRHWQHFASMRPFFLPGGERASMEPWRSAAALCWETGHTLTWNPVGVDLVRQAWERRINSPQSTAVGRLFDAAAAILGLCQHASFTGQAAMLLEATSEGKPAPLELPLTTTDSGLWSCDWQPLIPMLLDATQSVATRAAKFHVTLAQGILQQAHKARELRGITQIGMAGGVFQNRLLTKLAIRMLIDADFTVKLPHTVPINDAGISYGQIMECKH